MKNIALTLLLSLLFQLFSLGQTDFNVTVEEEIFSGFPALQSFVFGEYDGKWVLIGGRTDGLHQRQPFAAFQPDGNNTAVYVADINTKQVWSKPVAGLPVDLLEQLQTTNMEFEQRDSVLYIVGGYGYSASLNQWITHPFLTAVNLPGLVQAVVNSGNIAPHFRQLGDERMMVTGGYLGRLDDDFYLVGGQMFEGRYNPMGPTHGPGFIQEYTNAIRKFRIQDNGATLAITNYQETVDTANLHRRDYNMAAQIFPDGRRGFTVFSGVFQYNQDIPWLNTVDVDSAGYSVNGNFNQYLNQYHTAHAGMYSASQNQMHSLFFGGISRYFLNANGVLTDDPDVPFVKTISMVTRSGDGSMQEFKLGDMPGLLGSGAEFVPAAGLPVFENGIFRFDELSSAKTLLGYIIGGIESSQPNIFFINDGNQSQASGKVLKVFLEKTATASVEIRGEQYFGLKLFPNPATGKLTINFLVPVSDEVFITLSDTTGRLVKQETRKLESGEYELTYDLAGMTAGAYFFELKNKRYRVVKEFVKQ